MLSENILNRITEYNSNEKWRSCILNHLCDLNDTIKDFIFENGYDSPSYIKEELDNIFNEIGSDKEDFLSIFNQITTKKIEDYITLITEWDDE